MSVTKFFFAAVWAAVSVVAGLSAEAPRDTAPREINVSYVRSPFNLPDIVMRKQGLLEKAFAAQGVKVNYYDIDSGAEQARALASGSLDVAGVMGDTSVLVSAGAGNDIRIVGGFSRPANMFSIVAMDPGITSVDGLKGKRIAGPKGTVLHQLLAAALVSRGMGMGDVDFIQMDIPKSRAALLAGKVDVALLAGSLTLKTLEAGGHIVATAKGYVSPTLVIAARGSFLRDHPAAVRTYLEANAAALDWSKAHLDEALEIGAEDQGISVSDARKLYEWTEFVTKLSAGDVKTMGDDVAFMVENGMMQKTLDPRDFIEGSAIAQ